MLTALEALKKRRMSKRSVEDSSEVVSEEEQSPSNKKVKSDEHENKCVICLDSMSGQHRNLGASMPCGHVFHEDCYRGFEVSVLEKKAAFEADSDDEDEEVRKPKLKCPTCSQDIERFGKIFLKFGESEAPSDIPSSMKDVPLDNLIRWYLWSPQEEIVVKTVEELLSRDFLSDEFWKLGGHLALVRAMERHAGNEIIQHVGADIFVSHIHDASYSVDALHAIDAIACLVKAIENHTENVRLLGVAIAVVGFLSEKKLEASSRFVVEDGVPILLDAVKKHPQEHDVVCEAMRMFKLVVCRHGGVAKTFGREGGVEIVIDALKDQQFGIYCETIHNQGCQILSVLANTSRENHKLVLDHGGVTAVAASYEKFQDDSTVRDAAHDALVQITKTHHWWH